jgi:hypothetical protein
VQISSANTRFQDPDKNIVNAGGGLRDILQPKAGFGVGLHECFQMNLTAASFRIVALQPKYASASLKRSHSI